MSGEKPVESEIQFLLSLVLNHKLSSEVKKLCLERIGKIEESLRASPVTSPRSVSLPVVGTIGNGVIQAPSMQRILEQAQVPPPVAAAPVHIPPTARDKETGMVNVVTSTTPGGSTRGPSKVFR